MPKGVGNAADRRRAVLAFFGQSFRYTVVVIAGFAIDIAVATFLAVALGVALSGAAVAGFLSGLAFNYVAHALWTFSSHGGHFSARRALRFTLASLLTLGIRLVALEVLAATVPNLVSYPALLFTLAGGLSFLANFVLLKCCVFSPP